MQKLAELCIRRPVFATMLILALVVIGLDSYRKLGVDYFPKVEFPFVTITTTLRGASPEEVESQVTKPLEEVLNTIAGIDDLNSSSFEGQSIISIGFVLEKDPEVAAQEVRDKISTVLGQLPQDADPPIVEKIATDAAPVLNIVISAKRDLREVTKLVDDRLKKNIESLNGVGQVRFVGERKREIQVEVDGGKLFAYGLNIEQVRAALAAQNIEIPGGRIEQGNREISVRTMGRIERPVHFNRVIVGNSGGSSIRLSDIAKVIDGYQEVRSLARLDGKPAVVLAVRKQAGTNSLDVIANVKQRISELKAGLPPDFEITYARDQSGYIQAAFDAVQEHLVLGGFLAAIIVLLFIRSWRSTLIAAISIPTSIISTYSLMQWMGFTLNQITMLALTLVVGIVIDDAIVVLENIFRFMEEKKMDPVTAAIEGTKDIGLAVLATTLSLVIIFIPVALMPGIVGRFMSSFGYTAAFAIMVSLLVSFTLTPMLCSKFLRPSDVQKSTKETWLFRILAVPYRYLLTWSMRHRWVIVAISAVVFFSIVPIMQRLGIDFLPVDDQSEFEITVRMPVGSSVEGTNQVLSEMEKEVKTLPGVRAMLTLIGADQRKQVDRGSILVELVSPKDRKQSQQQLMDQMRRSLTKYKDVIVGVQLPSLISGGADREFMYSLQGPDLKKLEVYAGTLLKRLKQVPGLYDLDSSYESGKPEVRVNINRDKAADLGVNAAAVANAVRVLVGGDDQVTTYKEGDDRYDVRLRVSNEFRSSADAMQRLYLPSTKLGNVSIASVATLERGSGPVSIERWNRQRRIMVSGNISKGAALADVLKLSADTLEELNMPAEYRHDAVGRSKELGRAVNAYLAAFVLSLVFMYMILASQYESFIDPVTILLSLPLSIPFALISLFLAGENFSVIYTSLGILVLFGIVKKNSILQIDHIKSLRRAGVERLEAILRGCEDRLRPILMTTAALIAGMMPLAVGTGEGSGTRRTVAIVVIGGQTLALLLTLLVTPVAYSIFDDLAHTPLWRRATGWISRRKRVPVLPLLLLAFMAPVFSQGVDTSARVGVSIVERKLTLDEAIQMALNNNLDLEIERTNVATAQQAIEGARGFWDPRFQWTPLLESRATPVANTLVAPNGKLNEHFLNQNFSFLQPTQWNGFAARVDFLNSRQSTSNPFTGLSPYYQTGLVFSLSKPLWRGRLTDQPRTELVVRRKQANLSENGYETRVIDIVTRVENAYWDLAAALQDVQVESEGVQLAREQLARNQRMIASGTLAPVELAASEAELQRRLDSYISSVGVVTLAENNLKLLLSPARDSDIWGDRIIPIDRSTIEPPQDNLKDTMDTALQRRPELKSLAIRNEVNQAQMNLARDLTKPQVNLVGSYTNAGLAGTVVQGSGGFGQAFGQITERVNVLSAMAGLPPLPPVNLSGGAPASLVGGYGQSLSNLFSGAYQSAQAGLQIDWTIRNRTAESQLAQTAIAERRISYERRQVSQAIEAEVRNSLQGVQTARQRIQASTAAQRAAQEKLDSEVRLFQTGESTNFLVLVRQNEVLDARRRAVQATLLLNRAVAALTKAVGTTLETKRITLK